MTVIKVRWHVDELTNVLSLFTTQKVYRSTTGDSGPFVEITTPLTRVPLVVGVADYLFDDVAGAVNYYYRVAYFNAATLLESGPSEAQRGGISGYVTLADVRNQGYPETLVTDAQIARAAWMATTMIDRVTRQWFEARRRAFRVDGRGGTELALNVPIIGVLVLKIEDVDVPLTRDSVLIYNRHLTQGLESPDDRNNPRLVLYPSDRRWTKGAQNVWLDGYFGHTELGPDDVPGETTTPQYPSTFGRTPALIKQVALRLTSRLMWGLAGGRGDEFAAAARIVAETTRDESYTLAPLSAADAEWGITGDLESDSILAMFAAPLSAGGV